MKISNRSTKNFLVIGHI